MTCLVTLFDRKLQIFKNKPKYAIFGLFNELLSTQNVNVARFAGNVDRRTLGKILVAVQPKEKEDAIYPQIKTT